eukprot:COSAG01_NODE_23_length_37704_cov_30.005877_46_plen_61_part_00
MARKWRARRIIKQASSGTSEAAGGGGGGAGPSPSCPRTHVVFQSEIPLPFDGFCVACIIS